MAPSRPRTLFPPLRSSRGRDAIALAMKDSWSPGEDRRDRGRVDRGVIHSRRSRSPIARRRETDRAIKPRERSVERSGTHHRHGEGRRDRSRERKRGSSASPLRDTREEVRERNRGRELLEPRSTQKSKHSIQHSPPRSKRHQSRSVSPHRGHNKRPSRKESRSPRREGVTESVLQAIKKITAPSPIPSRKRSLERRASDYYSEPKAKRHRDYERSDKRGRSPLHRQDREEFGPQYGKPSVHRYRSPQPSPNRISKRNRSPYSRPAEYDRPRNHSPLAPRYSSERDRYGPSHRSRPQSPRAPRGSRPSRGSSPNPNLEPLGGRPRRDDRRPSSGSTSSRPTSGQPPSATGANSIEVKSEKMAGRGFYGNQHGYNQTQQMQAAFPLKPQYNQAPVDPRQYSQSPQHHMTPHSYHGSPAQSPYSGGRGNWSGHQQYSQP